MALVEETAAISTVRAGRNQELERNAALAYATESCG